MYFLRNAEDKFAASDFRILHEHAAHLPGVLMVRTMTVGAALDPEVLARELRQEKLNTVVLAAEHPGFYQPTFARALALAGADGSQVRLASFGERGDGGTANRANDVVSSAVQGVPFGVPPSLQCPPDLTAKPW